nr:hypothetical protein CPGR_04330 [Mycolicibacter nonchromogenicus]
MAGVSIGTFWFSVPRSGLASTATTRSPRMEANVAPRVAVMVVLPTPPFSDSTAMRWQPCSGRFTWFTKSLKRMVRGLSPTLISCPDST